ncbi:MAG: aminotransferase class I/II-fold pyridoxal phosphate-dependent enzyme [Firmicutes bacterium]|nr:aminotransferase class I/II-fold pyridoxal phosphate-dependent enzyme [Bacillota bacterium]
MRQAMASAAVGDDVYGEDPTVAELEAKAARLVGKEAALFVSSGTMGNQVAIMTHTRRGDEVIVDSQAHIFIYEVGAPAVLSSVQLHPVESGTPPHGLYDPSRLARAIRTENVHYPPTALICLENTHNRYGGAVVSVETMSRVYELAKENGIAVHLDGARIFNAAAASGRPVTDFTQFADSVMFCLSKGLAAPVGSILAGSSDFIRRARKNRKILGGGWRQAGILAVAGLVALDTMIARLPEDHTNARELAEGLNTHTCLWVDMDWVQTNIVVAHTDRCGVPAEEASRRLAQAGVLANATGPDTLRLVTHKDVTAQDVVEAVARIARVFPN